MKLKNIQLKNFRNYTEQEITFADSANIFLGPNAQGKTNILEAVYYAALGRSHRTNQDTDLINWQEKESRTKLSFLRLDVPNTLEFNFSREKKRRIVYNGHPILHKNLIGTLNAVLFSPEDLFLIKGTPAIRRRFLNGEISQASPSYYNELMKYTKIISQRNALLKRLKEGLSSPNLLEPWDLAAADSATKITAKRIRAVKKLGDIARKMQERISGKLENLQITYDIHGLTPEENRDSLYNWYINKLQTRRDLDIIRGVTTIGPHHDDIILTVNDINLRSFGSQGQQRTGALALKLAEMEFLYAETGEYPVLLLDDVMSELDKDRRKALLDFIGEQKIQTLITATDEAYFPKETAGRVFRVQAGKVCREV